MKKLLRIMSALTIFIMLMSFSSVAAFATEANSFASNITGIYGDADNNGDISIKDATIIQKYLAKLAEFSDDVYKYADVNASGDVTISDATLVQKFVAHIIESFPAEEEKTSKAILIDVEFAGDTAFGTDFTIEEAGFYNINATPLTDCSLSFLVSGSKDKEMWYSQSDGESDFCYALFEEGEYHIAVYPEGDCDVKASVVIEKTKKEHFFDIDEAKRIKLGAREELQADGSVKVFKFNNNSLNEENDICYIYTEGENTSANITVYSDVYAVIGSCEMREDGNVEAFIFPDGINTFSYIVVECYEDGEDFTLYLESLTDFSERMIDEVNLGTAYEIMIEKLAGEDPDEEAVYVGEFVCEFVPSESGYYSITYTSDELVMVNHTIIENYDMNSYGEFFFREADSNSVKDVRYFEEGESYYIEAVANTKSDSKPLNFEIETSTEEEYNRVRLEDGEVFC